MVIEDLHSIENQDVGDLFPTNGIVRPIPRRVDELARPSNVRDASGGLEQVNSIVPSNPGQHFNSNIQNDLVESSNPECSTTQTLNHLGLVHYEGVFKPRFKVCCFLDDKSFNSVNDGLVNLADSHMTYEGFPFSLITLGLRVIHYTYRYRIFLGFFWKFRFL